MFFPQSESGRRMLSLRTAAHTAKAPLGRAISGVLCLRREMGTKATAKSCVKPGATLVVDGSLIRVDRITQGGKARAGITFRSI